jgi:3-hydroxyacyl-CoA dehydrogenase
MMRRQRIVIIGPGRMGLGIALAFALHKFEIKVLDLKSRLPGEYDTVEEKAKQELTSDLKLLKRIGYLKGSLEKIVSNSSFLHGLKEEHLQGDFVFEAIRGRFNNPSYHLEIYKALFSFALQIEFVLL